MAATLECLFTATRADGTDCVCACHPSLPSEPFHEFGFRCPCTFSEREREAAAESWRRKHEEYLASPEAQEARAANRAEENALVAWLVAHPDVVVTSWGGLFPEQWWGSVGGRRFYFREKRDEWRIELDLRPTGRFHRVWKGGDLDDEDSPELRESEEGDVIAEGTINTPDYGSNAVERIEFIVGTIRDHVTRAVCPHRDRRAATESALGRRIAWCPDCGTRQP